MPIAPNYKSGVGQLTTSRYDFQKHLDGYGGTGSIHNTGSRHTTDQLDLSGTVLGSTSFTGTVSNALITINGTINAINGVISSDLLLLPTGDLAGTPGNVEVAGIQSHPIFNVPGDGKVLVYNTGDGYWHNSYLNDSNIQSAAAISGSKITPNFGAGNIITVGTLAAHNTTITGTLSAGNTALSGTLASGNATITGTLSVSSNTILAGNTSLDGYAIISGVTTLNGILNVNSGFNANFNAVGGPTDLPDRDYAYFVGSSDFIVPAYSDPSIVGATGETIILPPIVSSIGKIAIIKDVGYNASARNITITTYENNLYYPATVSYVNNNNHITIHTNGASVMLLCDGVGWHVLAVSTVTNVI